MDTTGRRRHRAGKADVDPRFQHLCPRDATRRFRVSVKPPLADEYSPAGWRRS